jgi:hypothetical protein
MQELAKETVIVVHGTWAAPDPQKRSWYQRPEASSPEGFTTKLDEALQARGSSARCWAHCVHDDQIFQWSGENSWIARTRAAAALGDYVERLREMGWRCHIIAHSHGGNIVVEALPRLISAPEVKEFLGKIITLGTPFVDTMSPIIKRMTLVRRTLTAISWIGFAWILFGCLESIWVYEYGPPHRSASFFFEAAWIVWVEYFFVPFLLTMQLTGLDAVVACCFVLLIVTAVWVFRSFRNRRLMVSNEGWKSQPNFLAIGSKYDEAWQILHHMRVVENPLAIKTPFFRYIGQRIRLQILQNSQVARIYGAKSFRDLRIIGKCALLVAGLAFILVVAGPLVVGREELAQAYLARRAVNYDLMLFYVLPSAVFAAGFILFFTRMLGADFYSAALTPIRWCLHRFFAVTGIFSETVTYLIRRQGWSVLLAMAMGLEGYKHKLPVVEWYPRWLIKDFLGYYQDLPPGAVRRALGRVLINSGPMSGSLPSPCRLGLATFFLFALPLASNSAAIRGTETMISRPRPARGHLSLHPKRKVRF